MWETLRIIGLKLGLSSVLNVLTIGSYTHLLIFPITDNIVITVVVDKLHHLITLNIEYLESKNFTYN
jgi:hypothetical protein